MYHYKLTKEQDIFFRDCIYDLATLPETEIMKKCKQHKYTSCYQHCLYVSYYSYMLSIALHLKIDNRKLIRAAFLHDFFLYDWRKDDRTHT